MSSTIADRAMVTVTLQRDGTGTVALGDQTVPVRGAVLSDARVQALEIVRAVAAQLGRPLRVHAIDPTSSAYLTVDPSGTIHDIDQRPVSDPMPAPDQVTPAAEESELSAAVVDPEPETGDDVDQLDDVPVPDEPDDLGAAALSWWPASDVDDVDDAAVPVPDVPAVGIDGSAGERQDAEPSHRQATIHAPAPDSETAPPFTQVPLDSATLSEEGDPAPARPAAGDGPQPATEAAAEVPAIDASEYEGESTDAVDESEPEPTVPDGDAGAGPSGPAVDTTDDGFEPTELDVDEHALGGAATATELDVDQASAPLVDDADLSWWGSGPTIEAPSVPAPAVFVDVQAEVRPAQVTPVVPPALVPLGDVEATPITRRRPIALAVTAVIVVAALAWGGFEVWKARDLADARDGLTAAVVSTARELDRLTSEISQARTVLEHSEGQVADEATREHLAEVLDRADEVAATAGQAGEPGEVYGIASADGTISGTVPDRPGAVRRIARELTDNAGELAGVRADLAAAVDAVTKSIAARELATATTAADDARASLSAQIDQAQAVLDGSEGQVANESLRTMLAGALADARDVIAADQLDDIPGMRAAAQQYNDARQKVEAAAVAVRDAQDAWTQAQQAPTQAEPDTAPQQTTPAKTPQQTTPQQQAPVEAQPQQPAPVQPDPAPDPAPPATGSVTVTGSFTSCSGPVTVVLAGQTRTTSVNSAGVFSVAFSGVPLGTHPFTATCDGLTAPGTVVVR